MTGNGFDPAPAARRLAGMWRNWQQLDALPAEERPHSIDDAYRLQRRLIDEIGEPIRGYKMGLSSAAAMERSGLGCPILGFVPHSRLHRSGAILDIPVPGPVLLEAEIALTLPVDWKNGGRSAPEASLVFEIVRSRFARRTEIDLPSFVGDASGFHALVVGDPIPLGKLAPLLRDGGTIRHDGRVVTSAVEGRERPDALEVLKHFHELVTHYDMPIGPGMIVATGSLVVPFETEAGGVFEASLGTSSVHFIARRSV